MKKLIFVLIISLMSIAVWPQRIESNFVRQYNKSAFEIYNKILNQRKNQVFSPLFLSQNFSPLYLGSRGVTRQQLQYVFGYPGDEAQFFSLQRFFRDLMISNNNYNTRIESFVGMIMQDSLQRFMRQGFEQKLPQLDLDTIIFLDLATFGGEKQDKINDLVRNWTIDKLPRPIPQVEQEMKGGILLVSSGKFSGNWAQNFAELYRAPFYLDNYGRHTKSINYMTVSGYFKYSEGTEYDVVEVPYENERISLMIIIPHEDVDINELKKHISFDEYSLVVDGLRRQKIRLFLPLVEIHSVFSLRDTLQSMLPQVFRFGANFSSMVSKMVYVDQVYQAISFVIEPERRLPFRRFIDFQAEQARNKIVFINHPFIFIIRDVRSNTILFMGHVYKPI